MSSHTGIKLLIGTAGLGLEGREFGNGPSAHDFFTALSKYPNLVSGIDTSEYYDSYAGSESIIGAAHGGDIFLVDTKAPGAFMPGRGTREGIVRGLGESLKKLDVKAVDCFYLHSPDDSVPLEETLAGVNDAHKKGWFKKFGLSNFLPEQVQAVYDHCQEKGYVLPSQYQGNYSVFNRQAETLLMPLLRKLGFSFYCYSALAGGFTLKSKQEVIEGTGRFEKGTAFGDLYRDMYCRPTLLEALDEWEKIANDEGCSKGELAYRWVRFSSALKPELGDGMIFGVSRMAQLEETVKWLSGGPLSKSACERIDKMWDSVKGEAPLDTVNRGSEYGQAKM